MVPVPPLIAAALGVIGAAFAVKYFAKKWKRANANLDAANDVHVTDSKGVAVPKLRRDPETGIYRP